jgi:hypothetical protein
VNFINQELSNAKGCSKTWTKSVASLFSALWFGLLKNLGYQIVDYNTDQAVKIPIVA